MKTATSLLLLSLFTCYSAQGQTNLTDSFVHQTYERQFMVHFPPNFDTSSQRALVVSLHGGSGNMVNAQGFSQLNPVADQNDFVIAWPQGYGIAPPGFSWADGRNTSADQSGIDDVGFIDRLIDLLVTRYNIDTNRIFICGFSNGGFMVQRLACELPERFAAMASLGASMDILRYQNCNPSRPIPMAFFNGTADPAVPYGGGPMQNPQVTPIVAVETAVQYWVNHNGCQTVNPVVALPDIFPTDNSTAELYQYSNCDCNADVVFYKLINGGHTWPGVYVASQEAVLGNTNRDINGSDELWTFFNAHSRCDLTVGLDELSSPTSLTLYPNPTSGDISLSDYSRVQRIELYDLSGRKLCTKTDFTDRTLSLQQQASGVYNMRIFLTDGEVQTIKVVKE